MLITEVVLHFKAIFLYSYSAFLLFLGFLELKAVRENRERRRTVKEEYGLIFDGSPTEAATPLFASDVGNLVVMPVNVPKPLTYNP